jgi:hypothetical protein
MIRGSDSDGNTSDGGVSDHEQVSTVGEGDCSEDEVQSCSAPSQTSSGKPRVKRFRRSSGGSTSTDESLQVRISR